MAGYIDIHTHILPEMDDGSKSWDETLKMCRMAVEDGIKRIVVTPHIRYGNYWFEENEISGKADELRSRLKENNIPLDVTTGADVHLSPETLPLIEQGTYSINPGRKYVLIEIPDDYIPQKIEEMIFNLLIKGISPILSHPERNHEIQQNPQKLFELVGKGLFSQVTALSITGGFGKEVQKAAEVLINHNLVHFIASDAHSMDWRRPVLSEAVNKASQYAGEEYIEEMVRANPEAVVNGKEFASPEPVEIKTQTSKTFSFVKKLLRR